MDKYKVVKQQVKMKKKEITPIKRKFRSVGKVLLTIFLIGVITGCLVFGGMVFYVINFVKPDNIDLNREKLDYTSIVYGQNSSGQTVEVDRLSSQANRIWVDIDQVPKQLKDAVVSIEDQRFYEHEGVDWKRTIGAFGNMFLHYYGSMQGGSTITQQLVKNVTGKTEVSPYRKVQEIVTSLNLEKKYTKSQILESYLNTIPLGEAYGVQAAANTYFGKDVSKLDLAQCALLAGLTKAPSYYNPFLHADRAKIRQVAVLDKMLELGKITKAQYQKAKAEKLTYNKTQATAQKKAVQSYFVDQVITDVINDLVSQKGYTKAYAKNLIYNKGLRIYSTMDTRIQSIMEDVYENESYWVKLYGSVQPQSAMVIVDYNGQIKGIVGGRGQKTADMTLNRATASKRQPGSTIKPLAVYGPAIMYDKITWSTIEKDEYKAVITNDSGARVQWPKDDTGAPTNASMPVVTALARSVNTVAVGILKNDLGGAQLSFNFMTQKLGFTSLVKNRNGKSDINLSLAVGGVTDGVTVREMAGGYEIFGDNGVYTKPHTYTKVLDSEGKVVLQNKDSAVQAMDPDSATIMNKLLQQAIYRYDGTGYPAQISGTTVAGKTGTTTENKDRWFVGLTPYYVGAVWYGYDQPKEVSSYVGTNPALVAWRNVMRQVMMDLPSKSFPVSSGVVEESYNASTGLLLQSGTGSETGWFKASNLPGADTAAATSSSPNTKNNNGKSSGKNSSKQPSSSSSSSLPNSSDSQPSDSSSTSDNTGST